MKDTVKYQVVNRKTGKNVGKPVIGLRAANRKIDRLDCEYGAYIHSKHIVQ